MNQGDGWVITSRCLLQVKQWISERRIPLLQAQLSCAGVIAVDANNQVGMLSAVTGDGVDALVVEVQRRTLVKQRGDAVPHPVVRSKEARQLQTLRPVTFRLI